MFDIFKCAFRSLFRNIERTFLTLLGISIGVASVITIVYIGQSGAYAISGELDGLGMSGVAVGLSDYSGQNILSDKELSIIQSQPCVESAAPLIFETNTATVRNTTQNVYLWGIDYNAKDVISLSLTKGRFFNKNDVRSNAKVCMVDESFINSFNFISDNVLGKKIKISSGSTYMEYEIVGVIKTGSGLLQNIMGGYLPNFIYIPYTTMQENLNNNNYSQIAIRLYDNQNTNETGEKILTLLERNIGNKGVYTITDLAKQKENLNVIFNVVTTILSSIGTISLIVAGISIMTIMLVSVNERKREIGIKKAIGASRFLIMKEFLIEAIIVSLVGSFVGIALGFGISYAVSLFLGLAFQFRWNIIIYTLFCSLIFGVFFGIYPALKASTLKPVDALRLS